jgi:hypothetical protein
LEIILQFWHILILFIRGRFNASEYLKILFIDEKPNKQKALYVVCNYIQNLLSQYIIQMTNISINDFPANDLWVFMPNVKQIIYQKAKHYSF